MCASLSLRPDILFLQAERRNFYFMLRWRNSIKRGLYTTRGYYHQLQCKSAFCTTRRAHSTLMMRQPDAWRIFWCRHRVCVTRIMSLRCWVYIQNTPSAHVRESKRAQGDGFLSTTPILHSAGARRTTTWGLCVQNQNKSWKVNGAHRLKMQRRLIFYLCTRKPPAFSIRSTAWHFPSSNIMWSSHIKNMDLLDEPGCHLLVAVNLIKAEFIGRSPTDFSTQ